MKKLWWILPAMVFMMCASASALTLNVTYDAIRCGEPITFTCSTDSETPDECLYQLTSVSRYDDGEWVSVYDTSRASYPYKLTKENVIRLTLPASGKYWLKFQALDLGSGNASAFCRFYPFIVEDPDYPTVQQISDDLVRECLDAGMESDYEKALWLHDRLIDMGEYDYSLSYCSADGMLLRGKGTCESYHRALVMMLKSAGIQTARVTGDGHVWTLAKLDGDWVHIDATWDDADADPERHMYFGLTDDLMRFVHPEFTKVDTAVTCDSVNRNYFIRSGMIGRWTGDLITRAQAQLDLGNTEFDIDIPGATTTYIDRIPYTLASVALSRLDWGSEEGLYTGRFTYSDKIMHASFEHTLPHVFLPTNLKRIEAGAFADDPNLRSVVIPPSVTYIGDDAFNTTVAICCEDGSAAHAYAEANGLSHCPIP